jgi:hypothetical protein
MRFAVLFLCAALGGCALAERISWPRVDVGETEVGAATLAPADAATNLITGGPLGLRLSAPREAAPEGQDPVLTLTLTHADGRAMRFQSANHAPIDVMAQAPGGPLAQAMGFFGDEAPILYRMLADDGGAAFICPPGGPVNLGYFQAADGAVSIVGLRSAFEFETREDGSLTAAPVSPNIVCARMSFTRQ